MNQALTYELIVKNTGSSAVANVRVEEEPPSGVRFVSSEPPAEQSGTRLAWTFGLLEGGTEKRIKITVKPADEGEVRSRAVVTFSAATEARVRVTRPKLALAATGTEMARLGEEVVFTVRVSNNGTGPASKLLIQATLSDGLHHPQGNIIEASLDTLAAGESRTLTLRALATKSGSHACSVAAAVEGNPPETTKSNVTIVEPMLQARISGPAKCLVRGEPEFKIELVNPGTAATDGIQVNATIPEGFEVVSSSDAGSFQPTSRSIAWRLAPLAINARKELTFKLRANSPAEGVVRMSAVSAPDGVNPSAGKSGRVLEASGETGVRAEGVPAIRFEVMDVEDPIEVGKEAIYEIKIVNQGTAPCTNVNITAMLAEGTTATAATGPTQARGQGQTVTFDAITKLDVKQELVYRVKVKGNVSGDQRFRVQVVCDEIRTPIAKEESTRFVKD